LLPIMTLIYDENSVNVAVSWAGIEEAAMRRLAATTAALCLIALALTPVEARAQDATARLLTAEELNAAPRGPAPVILRGSAVHAKPAPAVPSEAGWQTAGGRRLWIVDPVAQEFRVCGLFQTTDVDVRQVRCWTRPTGRYARTFGPTFQP
jgi:hypothetical protein